VQLPSRFGVPLGDIVPTLQRGNAALDAPASQPLNHNRKNHYGKKSLPPGAGLGSQPRSYRFKTRQALISDAPET